MPRMKISMPEEFIFSMEYPVRYSDLDYAKHLNSVAMVYGFDIAFQVNNAALDRVVCNAKVGVVFFDFDRHKIASIPPAFRILLGQADQEELG